MPTKVQLELELTQEKRRSDALEARLVATLNTGTTLLRGFVAVVAGQQTEHDFLLSTAGVWQAAAQDELLSSDAVLSSYGQRSMAVIRNKGKSVSLHSAQHGDDAEMARLFDVLQRKGRGRALSPSPPPTSPDARPLQDHAGLVNGLSARESQSLIRSLGGDAAVAPKVAVSVRPLILPKKPKVEPVASFLRPVAESQMGRPSRQPREALGGLDTTEVLLHLPARLSRSPSPALAEAASSGTSKSTNLGSSDSKRANDYGAANKKKMTDMDVGIEGDKLEKTINPLLNCDDVVAFAFRLRNVLNKAKAVPKSAAFHRPVDAKKNKTYYDKISVPMDLRTMEDKLKKHAYTTLDAFRKDLDQIVENSLLFNGPASVFTQKAEEIRRTAVEAIAVEAESLASLEHNIQKALEAVEEESVVMEPRSFAELKAGVCEGWTHALYSELSNPGQIQEADSPTPIPRYRRRIV